MVETLKIEVIIERATDIPVVSTFSKTVSPYVSLIWKDYEPKKTGIAHSTQNPVFNQSFILETNDPSEFLGFPLILEIYDHNKLGKDSLIGTCSITPMPIANYQLGTKLNFVMPIYHQVKGFAGSLSFSVACVAGSSLATILPMRVGQHDKGANYIPWGIIEETTTVPYKDNANLSDVIQYAFCQCLDKINMKTNALDGKIISGLFSHNIFIDGPKQYIIVRVVGTVLSDEEIDRVNSITITTCQDLDESFSVFCPVFSSRVFVLPTVDSEQIETLFVSGWAQLRQDLRKQAKFYHCDIVHGYKEHFAIDGSTVVITAIGTVCKSNTPYLSIVTQDIPQPSIYRPNSSEKIMIRATGSIKRPKPLLVSEPTAPFSYACTSSFDATHATKSTKMIECISSMYQDATNQIGEFLDTNKYDSLFDLDIGISIKGSIIFLWITGTATCLKEIADALLVHSPDKPIIPGPPTQVKWSISPGRGLRNNKDCNNVVKKEEKEENDEETLTEKGLPTMSCVVRNINVTKSTLTPSGFVENQVAELKKAIGGGKNKVQIGDLTRDFFFQKSGQLIAVSQCSYTTGKSDSKFNNFAITPSEKIDGYKIVNELGIVQHILQQTAIKAKTTDEAINTSLDACYTILKAEAKARGANAIINARIEFPRILTSSKTEGIDFIIVDIYGDAVSIEPLV